MDQNIRAIETIYDGYRFRSRLEARWAVYFHEAGIPYIYEQEGFIVDGQYYLPDFYLPWFDAYIEIKPLHIDEEKEKEAKKNLEIMWFDADCKKVMIFFGDPMDNEKWIYCFSSCPDISKTNYEWVKFEFLEGAWYEDDSHGTTKHWISINVFGNVCWIYGDSLSGGNLYESMLDVSYYRTNFDYAKLKARQARFEHGETPEASV